MRLSEAFHSGQETTKQKAGFEVSGRRTRTAREYGGSDWMGVVYEMEKDQCMQRTCTEP